MTEQLDLDECEAIAKIAYLPQDMTLALIARIRELESNAGAEPVARTNALNGSTYTTWLVKLPDGKHDLYVAPPAAPTNHTVPAGYALVPIETTDTMLDRAVAFALNVSVSSEYRWTDYMRDLWAGMLAAAPQDRGGKGESK